MPTICFTLPGMTPQEFATRMGEAGVGLRDGHLFAPRLMKRLGLAMESGAIRVSLVHYNTIEEIRRFERDCRRACSRSGRVHRRFELPRRGAKIVEGANMNNESSHLRSGSPRRRVCLALDVGGSRRDGR